MNKYELIEILRAAADGIAGVDRSQELKLKNKSYKEIIYNFCKISIIHYFSNPINIKSGQPSSEDILQYVSEKLFEFDKKETYFTSCDVKKLADEMFRLMTNEEPPKEE